MKKIKPFTCAADVLRAVERFMSAEQPLGVLICDGKNRPESVFTLPDNGCTLKENVMARLNITGVRGDESVALVIFTQEEDPSEGTESVAVEARELKTAADVLGVSLLDIIITNGKTYFSFADESRRSVPEE